MRRNYPQEEPTGANKRLSVDTQGDICYQNGASNRSETGAPAVIIPSQQHVSWVNI